MTRFIKNNVPYILTAVIIAAILSSFSALLILNISLFYQIEASNFILATSSAISFVISLYLSNWIYK